MSDVLEYEFGPFRLRADGLLTAHGREIPLTPTEEAFLGVLVTAEGARVAKDEVAERAWSRSVPSDSSLGRCVHTLRRKLQQADPSLRVIATCYGRGYRVAVPVRRVSRDEPAPVPLPRGSLPDGLSQGGRA